MNIRKTQLENKKQIKNKKIKRWRIIFVVCSLSFVAHATQNNETDWLQKYQARKARSNDVIKVRSSLPNKRKWRLYCNARTSSSSTPLSAWEDAIFLVLLLAGDEDWNGRQAKTWGRVFVFCRTSQLWSNIDPHLRWEMHNIDLPWASSVRVLLQRLKMKSKGN